MIDKLIDWVRSLHNTTLEAACDRRVNKITQYAGELEDLAGQLSEFITDEDKRINEKIAEFERKLKESEGKQTKLVSKENQLRVLSKNWKKNMLDM